MPPLDTTTLAVISSLLNLVLVVVLVHAWKNGKTYPGFGFWIAGTVCWTIGSLLTLVLRQQLPLFVPVLIGNGLILLHPVLFYEGFLRHFQINRRWWGTPLNLVLLVAALILQAVFLFVVDDYNVRTANVSLAIALLFARIAVEPLLIARTCRSILWLLSLVLFPLILIMFQRGFWYLSPDMVTNAMTLVPQDPYLKLVLFLGLAIQVVLVYSYLALTGYRTEHELKQSQEKFRLLTEGSADLIWQLDKDLRIVYVNKVCGARLGYAVEEMTGRTVFDFVSESDREAARQANEGRHRLEQQGTVTGIIRHELQLLHKNGTLIWCEALANPIRNEQGTITAYIAVVRDISTRKQDQQQLVHELETEKQVRAEHDYFLEMIAHEYRTPLAIMQTSINIIEKKYANHQQGLSGYLDKMQRAIDRLIDIFESAKRRQGISHLQNQPTLQPLDLDIFFRDTVLIATELWGDRFKARNLLPPETHLMIDQHLLRTALLNLLDNAVKYSMPDTTISLQFLQEQDQVQILVINQSNGKFDLDPHQPFRKFWRGANSISVSGTGIGLFLVNSIARQFNGTIDMQADQDYQVTATLSFPIATASEGTDAA